MRNLLIIALLLAAASMAGWFSVQRDGDHTTIEINRAEIRNDARQAIERGREILDRSELQARDSMSTSSQPSSPWVDSDPHRPAPSQPYRSGAADYTGSSRSYSQPPSYPR